MSADDIFVEPRQSAFLDDLQIQRTHSLTSASGTTTEDEVGPPPPPRNDSLRHSSEATVCADGYYCSDVGGGGETLIGCNTSSNFLLWIII